MFLHVHAAKLFFRSNLHVNKWKKFALTDYCLYTDKLTFSSSLLESDTDLFSASSAMFTS